MNLTGMIRLHDTLLAIDGVPVQNLDLTQVTHMLAGPVGAEVRVTLSRTVLSGTSRYTVRFARLAPTPSSRHHADHVQAVARGAEEETGAEAQAESLARTHRKNTICMNFVKSWRDESSRQKVVRNTCVTMLLQECRAKARTGALRAWFSWTKLKTFQTAQLMRFRHLAVHLLQRSRRAEREAIMHQKAKQSSSATGVVPSSSADAAEEQAPTRLQEKLAAECDRLRMENLRLRKAASQSNSEIAQLTLWKEEAEERERSHSDALAAAQHEHAQVVLLLQSERERLEEAERKFAREREQRARRLQPQHHSCSECGNVQVLFVDDHDGIGGEDGGGPSRSPRRLAKLCHCSCESKLQVRGANWLALRAGLPCLEGFGGVFIRG